MKRSTRSIIDEYKGKLSGYVALQSYRQVNLCIKADPISLLGVTVDVDGLTMNIEEIADVGPGSDEFSINVYPKEEKYILMIGKGIAEEHVEFKQEMETLKLGNGDEMRYIRLVMPEVNEDRKKVLTDAVKALHDECAAKIDLNKTAYAAKLTADLVGVSKEDAEAAQKEMDEVTEMHKKACEDLTAGKNQEIEEAYAAFQEKEAKRQAEESEESEAAGKDKVSNLKL